MNLKTKFPIFDHHPELVYLDSGATTHKPKVVIDAMTRFLNEGYGTVHRGIYDLSVHATNAYNESREKVKGFINAKTSKNIVFTRGTTDSINLIAHGYVNHILNPGDEILITEIEHHANFVPWQKVAEANNAIVKYAEVKDNGDLDIENFFNQITPKTKFIAITHISNVLGTVMPIKLIIDKAKEKNIKILIDGAQAIAHESIDIQALDPDVYCFSGHKMYGPTGIGVCYINDRIIDEVKPITFGGDMIHTVSKEGTTFTEAPLKFEAGTPPITEAIGLSAAVDFVESIGRETIKTYEKKLTETALNKLKELPYVELIGDPTDRSSAISFNIAGIHPHDLGTILDTENIAIRVGHHCAQPTMKRFNVPATARVSFGVYNVESDIDALIKALKKAREVFGY